MFEFFYDYCFVSTQRDKITVSSQSALNVIGFLKII